VALLMTTGHRIADAYGLADVVPYTGLDSINTFDQLDTMVASLRDAGGNTIVTPEARPVFYAALMKHGFALATASGLHRGDVREAAFARALTEANREHQLVKWVDTKHLHPRALRAR
jgi:hypothetical protein